MALTSKFTVAVFSKLTGPAGLADVVAEVNKAPNVELADGTGANQADRRHESTRTVAASGTLDLDLTGDATFKDDLGNAVSFARVKAIVVSAAVGNTNNVVVGAAATNPFVGPFGAGTHTVQVRPGGLLALVCKDATGWAVVAGTGDLLRFTNSGAGTSVTFDVYIVGASV